MTARSRSAARLFGSSPAARAAGRSCTANCSTGPRLRLAPVRGRTYEDAGVSLAAADEVVERLPAAVESTGARGVGAVAGLYPLGDGRLLAATTDGVGSKLVLSRRVGRLRDAGRDLAAHCIDDVLTTGGHATFPPERLADYA